MRICTRTGLALIDTPVTGYRIVKSSYGPLNPLPRLAGEAERAGWSRFDTPGRTLYLADTRRTAFAETLSPARVSNSFHSAAAYAAQQFGLSEDEAKKVIEEEWARNGNMVPGWLPAAWREGRLMYHLQVQDPSPWVDLTAAESIAALNRALGESLHTRLSLEAITLGTLAGENRAATTLIAEWTRAQVLDDGSYAAGVRFHSKFGGGDCWAYWMRRTDDGLGPDPVQIIEAGEIHRDDADLTHVLNLYGASCR